MQSDKVHLLQELCLVYPTAIANLIASFHNPAEFSVLVWLDGLETSKYRPKNPAKEFYFRSESMVRYSYMPSRLCPQIDDLMFDFRKIRNEDCWTVQLALCNANGRPRWYRNSWEFSMNDLVDFYTSSGHTDSDVRECRCKTAREHLCTSNVDVRMKYDEWFGNHYLWFAMHGILE